MGDTSVKEMFFKIDGRQSLSIPINLRKNGRYLVDPVNIIVKGIIKFEREGEASAFEETELFQEQSASLLQNKVIAYPVIFSSDTVAINNGRGSIRLSRRSEDLIMDISSLEEVSPDETESLSSAESFENIFRITIISGQIREPYKISIQVIIVDDDLYGATVDRGTEAEIARDTESTLSTKERSQASSNIVIQCYNDEEWLPVTDAILDGSDSDSETILEEIEKLRVDIPFGISMRNEAIVRASDIIDENKIVGNYDMIYLFTDNDITVSNYSIDETVDRVNSIKGDKEVPVLAVNFAISDTPTLSTRSNRSDTHDVNKISFLTGGQSLTVASENYTNDIINILYRQSVGAIGYGYCEFIVPFESNIFINSLKLNGSINDDRNSISWKISTSEDGYAYTEFGESYDVNTEIEFFGLEALYIKIQITFLTGFSFEVDPYIGVSSVISPEVNSFVINYNESKISYLFLNSIDENILPTQIVVSIDAQKDNVEDVSDPVPLLDSTELEKGEILVGMAKSNSSTWDDYHNNSQPLINQSGKIVVPIRYSKYSDDFPQEPLNRVDRFSLKADYGAWDAWDTVVIFDEDRNIIDSSLYRAYSRRGIVIMGSPLDVDYKDGDYVISITNILDARLGLQVVNKSIDYPIDLYGVGYMYTTGKDLAAPVAKDAPEASEISIIPTIPTLYTKVKVDYIYYDKNLEPEDASKTLIKWYVNDVYIDYLDNFREWNNIFNENDPLYSHAFSFSFSDSATEEEIINQARLHSESILRVGDKLHYTIQVSDGSLLAEVQKSEIASIIAGAPSVEEIVINGINNQGNLVPTVEGNNIAIVSYTLKSDTEFSDVEIVWFVNSRLFKRGMASEEGTEKLLPGENSTLTGEYAIRMGNELYAQITPISGAELGDPITSDTVVVQNSTPTVDSVVFANPQPTEAQQIVLTWVYFDFEITALADATQYDTTVVRWYKKEPTESVTTPFNLVTTLREEPFATGFSLNRSISGASSAIIDVAQTQAGQQWYAEIYPGDSLYDALEEGKDPIISDTITVLSVNQVP
jgi:hypothetical protein